MTAKRPKVAEWLRIKLPASAWKYKRSAMRSANAARSDLMDALTPINSKGAQMGRVHAVVMAAGARALGLHDAIVR